MKNDENFKYKVLIIDNNFETLASVNTFWKSLKGEKKKKEKDPDSPSHQENRLDLDTDLFFQGAKSLEEGLQIFDDSVERGGPFPLVIIELDQSATRGLEIAFEIKKKSAYVEFIFTSSSDFHFNDFFKYAGKGFTFLSRPFSTTALFSLIKRVSNYSKILQLTNELVLENFKGHTSSWADIFSYINRISLKMKKALGVNILILSYDKNKKQPLNKIYQDDWPLDDKKTKEVVSDFIKDKNNFLFYENSQFFCFGTTLYFALGYLKKGIILNAEEKKSIELYFSKIDQIFKEWGLINEINSLSESKKQTAKAAFEFKEEMWEKKKALKRQQEFMASLGHEFRTPMNAIIGFTHLLIDDIKSNKLSFETMEKRYEAKSFLNSIQTGANNLLSLVNNIMDYSKMMLGELNFIYKPANLNKTFQEIKGLYFLEAQKKGLRFDLNISKNFPKFILVDQNRLKQCLLNIVGNSLKYTEKGTISIEVETKDKIFHRPETKNNKEAIFIDGSTYYNIGTVDLEIKIRDTGTGIQKENLHNLFNSFGQAATSKKSGLGLSIAKGIIDIMKGKILVESTIGKGSLFTLQLSDLEIFEQENKENENADETIDISNIVFKESTILFIEDFPLDRLLFEKYMEHLGLNLIEVSNATDGLEKLQTLTPDLIITDILLPGMNGLDFAKKVKSFEKTKNIPLFAISSLYSDNNMEPDCKKEISKEEILNIFDELLTKPLTINNLVYKLSQFLPFESSTEKKEQLLKEKEKESLKDKEMLFLFLDEVLKNKFPLIRGAEATINDLEDFGRMVVNEAKKHHCKRLEKWATGLTLATLEFNMEDVRRILEKLPNEINIIKNF